MKPTREEVLKTLARLKADARAMAGHSERRDRAERNLRGFMADNPPPEHPDVTWAREFTERFPEKKP